jgi:hypothetical protein
MSKTTAKGEQVMPTRKQARRNQVRATVNKMRNYLERKGFALHTPSGVYTSPDIKCWFAVSEMGWVSLNHQYRLPRIGGKTFAELVVCLTAIEEQESARETGAPA